MELELFGTVVCDGGSSFTDVYFIVGNIFRLLHSSRFLGAVSSPM